MISKKLQLIGVSEESKKRLIKISEEKNLITSGGTDFHEMKKKSSIILRELEKKYKNERNDDIILKYLKEISVYKDERIKFHMDEMKNWLELNLKNKK